MNDQHRSGRGADWFLAHFPHTQEDTMGVYPPKPTPPPTNGTHWTQGGCLAAFTLCLAFTLGVCWLGVQVIR